MKTERAKRKLSAILSMDFREYRHLMSEDKMDIISPYLTLIGLLAFSCHSFSQNDARAGSLVAVCNGIPMATEGEADGLERAKGTRQERER